MAIDEKKLIECLAHDMSCFETDDKKISQLYVRVDDMVRMINGQPKIGGWIPCSERLPEEKINPVTNDFYEYQVTFKSDKVTDVRHYKFGRGHWWNCGQNMDKYVTAWQPLPEEYHG